MPFPRSQLDLLLVHENPLFPMAQPKVKEWLSALVSNGFVERTGRPTQKGQEYFGINNFRKLDLWSSKSIELFANHQGGYRVFCPETGGIITAGFVEAVTHWRGLGSPLNGMRLPNCTACKSSHSFVDLIGRPKFAFGMGALRFVDVSNVFDCSPFFKDFQKQFGDVHSVLKRVG